MTNLIQGKAQFAPTPNFSLTPGSGYKKLTLEESTNHLTTLSSMLVSLGKFVYDKYNKSPDTIPDPFHFEKFVMNVGKSIDALVLKQKIDLLSPTPELAEMINIDPNGSGYPLTIRDFNILDKERVQAEESLVKMPTDQQIVENALYTLFGGLYPKDSIRVKLAKDYYTLLKDVKPLTQTTQTEDEETGFKNGLHYFRRSIHRIDPTDNVPHFYNIFYTVPGDSYRSSDWRKELEAVLNNTKSVTASVELPQLAKTIEDIDGVMLECIERYDVGPYFSQYTENPPSLEELFKDTPVNTGMLIMTPYTITRTGQKERTGLSNFFKKTFSGDRYEGIFSPAIVNAATILMPYRLVQKLHNLQLDLAIQAQVVGITPDGGFQ